MYAAIRRYTPKGPVPPTGMDELAQQLREGFLPIVQDIKGFHGYYCLNVRDREVVTLSLFDTPQGAAESTKRAAQYVQDNPLPFPVNRPEVLEGEVLTYAESARELSVH